MQKLLKMALLLIIVNISFLNASVFSEYKSISWDWIAIIILVILFFLLLVSIIKDIKNNKKRLNAILIKEKCKRYDENCYINDINEQNINTLDKSINTLNSSNNLSNDKKIIDELTKNQKDIFANVHEANIFLNIATNRDIGKNGIFDISNSLKELSHYGLLKRTVVNINEKINYHFIGNKKVIQSIIFLLTRLQLRENGIKNPNIDVSFDDKKNILDISIPKELKLNQDVIDVIKNNLEPKYNNKKRKYYGVYLYLLNKLTDRVNGKLIIETIDNSKYKVSINLPIDVDNIIEDETMTTAKKLKNKRPALIISKSAERSILIEKYLKKYNFKIDIELSNELNKEIPNFLNYDIVFMDAELYEPILSDYIISVKKYSDIKVISLETKGRIYSYPKNLIDFSVDTSDLENSLTKTIFKFYGNDLIEQNSNADSDIHIEELIIPDRKSKVLIADDDRTNLHILEYLIKQYNVEVCTAKDGLEALEILDKNVCDLIILDSVMPNLDGFETIKKIRANEKYNATPVVIHTSFSLRENSIESIFKLGFDSYLPKPFNKGELKALLERYIPLSEPKKPIIEEKKPKELAKKDTLKSKNDLEEFLAIYSNSDKLIERYIKEHRNEQAISVLKDLKTISNKIGAFKFTNTLSKIEDNLSNDKEIDSNLMYTLSTNLEKLKSNIAKKLQD